MIKEGLIEGIAAKMKKSIAWTKEQTFSRRRGEIRNLTP
jgi:hypothetical protein